MPALYMMGEGYRVTGGGVGNPESGGLFLSWESRSIAVP